MLHNEILFKKDANGNPLDGDTLSVFWRLMSLPDDWELTMKGLQKITGFGSHKITKCINQLKELGYLQIYQITKNGKFAGCAYYLKEVLDENLWYTCQDPEVVNIENEIKNNPLCEQEENIEENEEILVNENRANSPIFLSSSDLDFPEPDFPLPEPPGPGKPWTIKNIINKENKNKENKKINKIFSFSKEKVGMAGQDKNKNYSHVTFNNQHENCSHETSLLEKKLSKANKQDTAAQEKFLDFMTCQDPINKPKQKVRPKKIKNKVQIKEMENMDSISTLDTIGYKNTIGHLTDTDNELSRAIKSSNEILALEKRVNMANKKKLSNQKIMLKYINEMITDAPIQTAMGDFLEMYINKYGVISKPALKLLYEDLKKLSNGDVKIQEELVKTAIKNQWKQFYLPKELKQTSIKQFTPTVSKPINPVFGGITNNKDNTSNTSTIATDENGNPISF